MDATGWLGLLAKAALGIVPVGLGVWTAAIYGGSMTNRLQTIQRGRTKQPPRLLVYGTPGIGKSTFAAQSPNPVFIPTEDGLGEIDCAKFPLAKSFEDVRGALQALVSEPHEFETVAIDSLDWLERLIWEQLCKDYNVSGIERVDGGFGKGYKHALGYWTEILGLLNTLRGQKGMTVILIAHTKIEKFEDPEAAPYDRYSPRLHKDAGALVSEWVDAVLFATRKFRTKTEDAGFNRTRTTAVAIGKDGGDRVIRTVGGPSCVAKNRYGITEELPLDWAAFAAALPVMSPLEQQFRDLTKSMKANALRAKLKEQYGQEEFSRLSIEQQEEIVGKIKAANEAAARKATEEAEARIAALPRTGSK